jgi:hypothetical protein
MVSAVTRVGIERLTQVLDRSDAVIEVRVVEGRDQPRRHGLDEEAVELGVVVRPLLTCVVRFLDLRGVKDDLGGVHPG